MNSLLGAIEAYYDAVPRTATRTEQVGPFTLFINPGPGFQYYARPTLGAAVFSAADVLRVCERQRALHVPEALEWVAEVTPGVRIAIEAAGMYVREHLLLVHNPAKHRSPLAVADVGLHLVGPEDDLATLGGVARVAFTWPGTAVGTAGGDEVAAAAAGRAPEALAFERARLRSRRTIMVAAYIDNHPVAVGSHQPVGDVTEIVGVATLPAFRRRGIASALTDVLVEDALRRGLQTVFLSAEDADVARVYERLGFRQEATACVAAGGQEPCTVAPQLGEHE